MFQGLNQLVATTILLSTGLGSLAIPHLPRQVGSTGTLHAGSNSKKCIDVRGAALENGTPVQIYDCNGSGAQDWTIQRGSTKVQLAGTNFCLDAGSDPENGVGMKIWQCYDGLPAQQWFYTDDNRIALQNQGLCLDLTEGDLSNSNQLQIYECTDNNHNQVWLEGPPGHIQPSPTTSTPPPSTTSPPVDTSPRVMHVLHPNADHTKCLDVRGAKLANGTPVQIYDCNDTGAQKWLIEQGSTKVQLAQSNFCLDAGANPVKGVGMKIWQCYDGLAAQQWNYTNSHIKLESTNLCVDLTDGSTTSGTQVQVWDCGDHNNNQIWIE